MIFEVSHRTVYNYSQPVSISHHLLHLTPRDAALADLPRLRGRDHRRRRRSGAPGVDYFGNPTTFVTIQQRHRRTGAARVEHASRSPNGQCRTPRRRRPGKRCAIWRVTDRSADGTGSAGILLRLALRAAASELRAYAARSFKPGRPILAAARELTHRIFPDFTYEPGRPRSATGVARAFAMRRGVCQDFAHIEIACLRALGLPARYVSGYLLTRPPAGKERLVGADASHAWLSVWIPGHDWVDLDPTNDVIPGREHITIGWGRDYGDVSPVSGVMFGGGEHKVAVAVDVRRRRLTGVMRRVWRGCGFRLRAGR